MARWWFGIGSIVASVALASTAHAEPSDQDKALATTLFNDAKTLLADGKVSEACRKLEESRRLDPQPGTILNLAVCHEREGLTASAWAEFREARVLAQRDGRGDRVELAEQHLRDLEPKLSWLVVVVPAETDAASLRIARDGTVLGRASWGSKIPVDPGDHVVEAQADGKHAWRATVTVKPEGDTERVEIPKLEDAEPAIEVPSPQAIAPPPPPAEATPGGLSTRRTFALAAAGAGVVGVGLGTFFGARAIVKHDDPNATCTTYPCSSTSVSLNDQAKFAADASTVSFAIALAGFAGAAILWFGDSSGRAVTLAPSWTRSGAAVGATARF
ncbi:MAG TPA: hypothetical protein VIF62_31075 [Labilithrix sp.]